MKLIKLKDKLLVTLSVLALLLLQNCERDDICAETTATTPQLVIEFYDAADSESLKSVLGFTVYGEDLVTDENGTPIEPEASSDKTLVFNSNVNTLNFPLLIGEEGTTITTRYILEKDTNLRLDDDATTNSNVDIIAITYVPEFVYVSRACGYKSIFKSLSIQVIPDGDNWITSTNILETTVENENSVHINIFH